MFSLDQESDQLIPAIKGTERLIDVEDYICDILIQGESQFRFPVSITDGIRQDYFY